MSKTISSDSNPAGLPEAVGNGHVARGLRDGWGMAASLRRVDAACASILGAPATLAVAVACCLLLASWVPHYLTWPWWPDTDQFATAAVSWHGGLRPYRDLADFDFPAPIYLFYVLGVTVGWGKGGTLPFNAVDAAFVALLGVAAAAWTRRRFGRVLPGLAAYLPFLCFYLSLDMSQVGQRDWHSSFFAVLSLLALESGAGLPGRIASAAAMGIALTYRPQAVVFFPAIVTALAQREGRDRADRPVRIVRRMVEWTIPLAAILFLAALPLLIAGIFGDFVYNLRLVRPGQLYNVRTPVSFARSLCTEVADPRTVSIIAANALLAVFGPPRMRATARTMTVALLGVLVYKPMSPYPHRYLVQPLMLVRSIALAPVVAWLLENTGITATCRLASVLAIGAAAGIAVPRFCRIAESLVAVADLAGGRPPAEPPPGCAHAYGRHQRSHCSPECRDRAGKPSRGSFRWDDFCRMLAYIGRSTPPHSRVANFIRTRPWPAINGPTGRLTPFSAAGGIIHLWFVEPKRQAQFARDLGLDSDAVVVWIPNPPRRANKLSFPMIESAIRRWYRFEARFGAIEVWRRIPVRERRDGRDQSRTAGSSARM